MTRTGAPGHPATRMVEYSSQRLDRNPHRTCGVNRPRPLDIRRISYQLILSELRKQSLTDSCSSRQCRIWDSLGHGCHSPLFHDEERQEERGSEGRGAVNKARIDEENRQEAAGLISEKRESHRCLNNGAKTKSLNHGGVKR